MISDSLKTFVAVAEHASFSKAAHSLFLTQPAVSMKIRILEEQFGQKLFIRDKKALLLTQAGEILFEHSQSLLKEVRNTEHQLQSLKNLQSGHLRIGISDTVCRYFLPQRLQKFIERYPDIQLSFLNKATPEIVELTHKHQVDVGFVLAPYDLGRLIYRSLFQYRDVLISASKYQLVNISDVERYPLLLLNRNTQTRELIDDEIKNLALTPKNIIEVGNTSVQKEFVKIGLGIGIVPDYALLPGDPFSRKNIPRFAKREIGICLTRVSSENPLVLRFLESIFPLNYELKLS